MERIEIIIGLLVGAAVLYGMYVVAGVVLELAET
jgi:hypothetical protein